MEVALVALAFGACCGLPLFLAGGVALLNKITDRNPQVGTVDDLMSSRADGEASVSPGDLEPREYDRRQKLRN